MIDDREGEARFRRVSTGNPQLDQILEGGFPANSINIVMGHPGTGKTIFVEQMIFENAGSDRPAVYITTLAEPLNKVVGYLQRFGFFDPDLMGGNVMYEDVGPGMIEHGVGYLVDYLREMIREVGPKIVVIDSFKAVHDLSTSTAEMRKLIWDLAGLLTAYDTTAFLVGEYSDTQIPLFPEFAVADGIVEFARQTSAKRDDRFVRVLKLRGSQYAEGFHAFTITEDGLQVFPRLVTPKAPADYASVSERVPTGVGGLDELLRGGLWKGSNTLVTGSTGSGKTTLALGFAIGGVKAGKHTLFCSFQENPTQLVRTVAALGENMADLERQGLRMFYNSPVELQIDRVVVELFAMIRDEGIQRVVIDSLGDLSMAADDPVRFHDYLYALTQHFVVNRVTSLMTLETQSMSATAEEPRMSAICDAVIDLKIDLNEPPRRTLRVVKARGTAHELSAREMIIEAGGLRLGAPGAKR